MVTDRTTSDEQIDQAVDGLVTFFEGRDTRAGVVARRLLGIVHNDDERLVEQLIRERRSKTRLDGSVDGSLQATAWSAWELLRLGCTKGHAGLDRMVGFLLSRQDQPGRFGEGCSERRHEMRTCNHFIGGFFSPGSRDEPSAPMALPTRAVIASEIAARFAVSCFALRAVLYAGEERRAAVRHHVESLLLLADKWREDEAQLPGNQDVVFCALGALGFSPPEFAPGVALFADEVAKRQTADGLWEGTPIFHSIDAILALRSAAAKKMIHRTLPALLDMQQTDGSFDETGDEEQALIALRALASSGAGPVLRRHGKLSQTVAHEEVGQPRP